MWILKRKGNDDWYGDCFYRQLERGCDGNMLHDDTKDFTTIFLNVNFLMENLFLCNQRMSFVILIRIILHGQKKL